MRLLMMASDLENNSLGRVYCLWLLARHLGWKVVVGAVKGSRVWAPLLGSEFADDCVAVSAERSSLSRFARNADLIVACKPFPTSLGVGAALAAEERRPLLLDIDDPDLEAALAAGRTIGSIGRRVGREILHHRWVSDLRAMARLVPRFPSIASNPMLANRYGSDVVPHVRAELQEGTIRSDDRVRVAFVGTVRKHKGVAVLRDAVASLAGDGFELIVTGEAPRDPLPWERWVGRTSLAGGLEIVAGADIVAVPSLTSVYTSGQLPVKVVDGMLLKRAIVASDLPPLRWAVGHSGVLVRPGNRAALRDGLSSLRGPVVRGALGTAARERAERMFSLDAVAPVFANACFRAVSMAT